MSSTPSDSDKISSESELMPQPGGVEGTVDRLNEAQECCEDFNKLKDDLVSMQDFHGAAAVVSTISILKRHFRL